MKFVYEIGLPFTQFKSTFNSCVVWKSTTRLPLGADLQNIFQHVLALTAEVKATKHRNTFQHLRVNHIKLLLLLLLLLPPPWPKLNWHRRIISKKDYFLTSAEWPDG